MAYVKRKTTISGFGTVGLKNGEPFVDMKTGELEIEHIYFSGEEKDLGILP